jgi:hypothetical protein
MKKRLAICEAEFRQLWCDVGIDRTGLAQHFGCSVSTVDQLRAKFGLPKRKTSRFRAKQTVPDPTPEEIAERARECRNRHYAEKLREPDILPVRLWRRELTNSA